MKVLDLDMDYFLNAEVHSIGESNTKRLPDNVYSEFVWSEQEVRRFLESNLGLSKEKRVPGRVVCGHNESLLFWKVLISEGRLDKPFEVIHVDSHADLGLGYHSWAYIFKELLKYPVEERPFHEEYHAFEKNNKAGIGDYLLFAIAYRMISSLTYCGNPNSECDDYIPYIIKDFAEKPVLKAGDPVKMEIQLLYNTDAIPSLDSWKTKKYLEDCVKEPAIPFVVIPRIEDVHFSGDFDYAVMAQSPNYTPWKADFIMDVFREYIEEI